VVVVVGSVVVVVGGVVVVVVGSTVVVVVVPGSVGSVGLPGPEGPGIVVVGATVGSVVDGVGSTTTAAVDVDVVPGPG
jgi:hypothetical protein